MRVTGRMAAFVLAWAAVAAFGTREARADNQWVGVHAGYYTEYEDWALGVNGREDVGKGWSVGFLGDYLFRSGRTTGVVNIDLQHEWALRQPRAYVWAGAGFGIVADDVHGSTIPINFDPLAVVHAGAGMHGKPVMPFVEVRLMSHDEFRGVLYIGVKF
jgi:hypothetical protein